MDLHPTAEALTRAETTYRRAVGAAARAKKARDAAREARDAAILDAIAEDPTVTNTDLAAEFGVVEGTVRAIRRKVEPGAPSAANS